MSSRYIRNLSEQWARAIPLLPYHPTVNEEVANPPAVWVTIDWTSFGATKETFCDDFREDGEIRLVFFGRAGIGYDQLFADAEAYANSFYANTDPTGRLVLTSKGVPDKFGTPDGPDFYVEIPINYTFQQ